MKIKYVNKVNVYGDHKIIECKPCCKEATKLIKDYISEDLIDSMVDKCPYCGEKIELICI